MLKLQIRSSSAALSKEVASTRTTLTARVHTKQPIGRAHHSMLQKVEAGDTSVSIGIYASVLQALGLLGGLSQIADISNDAVGQALASAELPKRVHLKRATGLSRDG